MRQVNDTSPQTTDPRPMRDYPCPHCGGSGEYLIDRCSRHGSPVDITTACGYCEGRGHFTRPVLPRGAVRAFAVLVNDLDYGWDEPEGIDIVYATSASKAKMAVARQYTSPPLVHDIPTIEILAHMHVRRAPEHDGEAAHAAPGGRA